MIPQVTFDQKSLHRILNDVPDGMLYIIKLKNGKVYYQVFNENSMYGITYKRKINKFVVYNGFIEIHYDLITINTKNNITETHTSIYFIPFDQIDYIKYTNVPKQ